MNEKSISEVLPKIDDRYWFDFSKSFLDEAIARRENAAAALQKLVLWLWGIYTASAAIGFGLSGKQLEFWPTLIIALASGVLILVYWGTVWVQVPIVVEFDPRSPTEIKQVYSKIIISKNKRLAFTLFLSVVAAIMVSIALVVASVSKPSEPAQTDFHAILSNDKSGAIVSVTAQVGEASIAELSVIPVSEEKPGHGETIVNRVIPTDKGLIQTSTRLKEKAETARIQLKWMDKRGIEVQLSKIIKLQEPPR